MDVLPRKSTKRVIEPVDEWLQNEGFYRKHIPKDPTCLFRAFAELIYLNQRSHIRVRKECIDFMRKNRNLFEKNISIPLENYLEQMSCFTEWGGTNEIKAMSLLYKKNVFVFNSQKLTQELVADHGFEDTINLCFSPLKQYDIVYSQEFTSNAAFCQSLVYRTLYKDVFKMENVDTTVHKMLHERNSHLKHNKFFLKGNMQMRNQLTVELLDKVNQTFEDNESNLLSRGITPFPYRVAKALDASIYRNIDFDSWQEIKREIRNSGRFNSSELQPGSKCLVQMCNKDFETNNNNNKVSSTSDNSENAKALVRVKRNEPLYYTGYIQEMNKNEGSTVVFIEELGQKKTVPFHALKPFPQRRIKHQNWALTLNKKSSISYSSKYKKPWNPSSRKIKDNSSNENNNLENKSKINLCNSKTVTKNVTSKAEWSAETTMENHSLKVQAERFTSYKEYSSVENVRTVMENTHISSVEKVEKTIIDKKNKNASINTDVTIKKQTNCNKENSQLKDQSKKSEFYPVYSNNTYPVSHHFLVDSNINYDVKNNNLDNNNMQYSDPVTENHFNNLGLKCFWSQNSWTAGPNPYYIDHNIAPNVNAINTYPRNVQNNMETLGPVEVKEENLNNKKLNNNVKYNRNGFQADNEVSKNKTDKHSFTNLDKNTEKSSNNKEASRNYNKSIGSGPRFKRNHEGKHRNDPQTSQQSHHQLQYQQQEAKYQYNRQEQESLVDVNNQYEVINQMQTQQIAAPLPQQAPLMTPVAPTNSYSYPVPYNPQIPYVPSVYATTDSDGYATHYYSTPTLYPIAYSNATDFPENNTLAGYATPVYPGVENYPVQYSTMFPQYVIHQPTIYSGVQSNINESCYSSYQSPPYYIPYTSPVPPAIGAVSPQNTQSF